jgi:hypothetical protein
MSITNKELIFNKFSHNILIKMNVKENKNNFLSMQILKHQKLLLKHKWYHLFKVKLIKYKYKIFYVKK